MKNNLTRGWPQGHVYAFEPVDKFYAESVQMIRTHSVHNATPFAYALAEKSGLHTFHYSTHIDATSSLLPSNPELNDVCNYQDTPMQVQCINLDEWAAQNNIDHINFMWLDMEGFEYYALKSAPHMLKTTDAILTEVNFREFRTGTTQYADLKKLLAEYGFSIYKVWGCSTWQGTALFVKTELIPNQA